MQTDRVVGVEGSGVHPAKRRAPEAWWRYTRHTISSTVPNGSLYTLAGVAFLAWHHARLSPQACNRGYYA
ncbi:hypothetical protein TRAPUB_12982 [Trametes pubescens]|uniref:Uncharacterized protein n=1 Tax=Trametes pubescens TaxID=154538 RepID=A0A1M2VSG4_TRAPU|nr:hypothetical protein TRAPUB_12982 [Trametes pubescens]